MLRPNKLTDEQHAFLVSLAPMIKRAAVAAMKRLKLRDESHEDIDDPMLNLKIHDYMQEGFIRAAELIMEGETNPKKFGAPVYQRMLAYFFGLPDKNGNGTGSRGECLIRVPRTRRKDKSRPKPHKIESIDLHKPIEHYQPRTYSSLDRWIKMQEFVCDFLSCCKDDVDRYIANELATGTPVPDIAQALGLTISTINKRKKRLFATFKERFPEYEDETR